MSRATTETETVQRRGIKLIAQQGAQNARLLAQKGSEWSATSAIYFAVVVAYSHAEFLRLPMGTSEIFIKCIPMTMLTAEACYRNRVPKDRALAQIATGLFLSGGGDAALCNNHRYFLLGLVLFLIAHIYYILAFTHRYSFSAMHTLVVGSLGVAVYGSLFPFLDGPMVFAVAIYVTAICSMLLASIDGGAHDKKLGITGALLFVISDLTLATNKFVPKAVVAIPSAKVVVSYTYFLAQWFIFHSVAKPVGAAEDAKVDKAR